MHGEDWSQDASKGPNRVVERAFLIVEHHVRTVKSQLDERYGARIDTRQSYLSFFFDDSIAER